MTNKLSLKNALKQKGAALILIAFILGLGATAFMIKSFNASNLQAKQDEKTIQALKKAKTALITWAVSQPNHPGIMPFPDRNDDPNGYDDKSDCVSYNVKGEHLLGRLPLLGDGNCVNPQTGIELDLRDGRGERLWYSVSINLVRMSAASATPVINPSIVNNPVAPWLTVRDRNGVVVSNHVAVVIMSAGTSFSGQNRSGTKAEPNQYLDKVVMADGTTYKNDGYQEFIMGEDSRNVSVSDLTFQKPYYFNDKLVYITIDELMTQLGRRAAGEAKSLLVKYQAKNLRFPFAAPLGAAKDNHKSDVTNTSGMIPIDSTDTCSCVSSQRCTCSFNPITSVTFTKNNDWSSPLDAGACKSASSQCTCTGAGSCSKSGSVISFSCDALGGCITNQTGVNVFTYAIPSYVGKPTVAGNCILKLGEVVCKDAGSFLLGLQEHAWFKNNLWQNYFYYHQSAATLQVGTHTGISALIINAGGLLGTQARSPGTITDYLEASNANLDNQYEATNKEKSSAYNDQVFIIAP